MAAKQSSHVVLALVVDAVLIAAFGVIGHYMHSRTLDLVGVFDTAWPFLLALVIAWLLNAVWREPLAPLRTGVGVWATTILLGMVIRALTDSGTAGAFIVVATGLNFVTIVGWRVIASAVAGRK